MTDAMREEFDSDHKRSYGFSAFNEQDGLPRDYDCARKWDSWCAAYAAGRRAGMEAAVTACEEFRDKRCLYVESIETCDECIRVIRALLAKEET